MPFTISKRMRFGDCDLTGIAYHPAYLSMLVDVNEAMFSSFGVEWKELMFERHLGLPSVRMNIEFSMHAQMEPGWHCMVAISVLRQIYSNPLV